MTSSSISGEQDVISVSSSNFEKLGGELTDGGLDIPIVSGIGVEYDGGLKLQCPPRKVFDLLHESHSVLLGPPPPYAVKTDGPPTKSSAVDGLDTRLVNVDSVPFSQGSPIENWGQISMRGLIRRAVHLSALVRNECCEGRDDRTQAGVDEAG